MTIDQKIKILLATLNLIASPSDWQQETEFSQGCISEDPPFTLSCALELGHKKIMGVHDGRSPVMNRIRWMILMHYFWRVGIHPIYSFSSNKKTTHKDTINLLQLTIKSFQS